MNTPLQDEQPKGAPGASPPKHKSTWRALFWAFLFCFVWLPLGSLFAYVSDFIPRPVALIFGTQWPPVLIASVILYPAIKGNPVSRAFKALLCAAALVGCAFVLWIVILRPSLGVGP
jgi:hypothetical protein